MPETPICASPEVRKVYEERRQLERSSNRPSRHTKIRWNHKTGASLVVVGFYSIVPAVIFGVGFMFFWLFLAPVVFGVTGVCFFLLPDTAAAKARKHRTRVEEKFAELVKKDEVVFLNTRFQDLWKQCYESAGLTDDPVAGLEKFPELFPLISRAQSLCWSAKDLGEAEAATEIDGIVEAVREEMKLALAKHIAERHFIETSRRIAEDAEKIEAQNRIRAEIDTFHATKSIT
jgi:hypothetical protein